MYFRAETPPGSPLSRVYLKPGCQRLGPCPLGRVESPLRRLSCRSVLTHLLNWHSCLAFPTGNLSTERENSELLSESLRVQDKSICRGKNKKKYNVQVLQTALQAPDISCTFLSCLQLLPEVFCHSHAYPGRSCLSVLWRLWARAAAWNRLGLQELQLYLLAAQSCHHEEVTEPPGWFPPALSHTSITKLGKFNQQLLRDPAHIYCQWSLHGLHRSFHLLVKKQNRKMILPLTLPSIRKRVRRFLKFIESD